MNDVIEPITKPLLSVIIGMPGDNSECLADVIRSMAAQSIASRIEVIVSAASRDMVRFPQGAFIDLADMRIIEIGPFKTFAQGIVPGIFAARAKIVVLWEDHAFAAPGRAEAIVADHARGYAAVGPSIENANPWSGRSWTHLLYDYGRFIRGEPQGEKGDLPGHNSSYLRETLIVFPSEQLCGMIEAFTLHAELKHRGHRLYLSGDAVCWHQNPSKAMASIWIRFTAHRHRAGARYQNENWSLPRRVTYAALWPLISVIRVYDVWMNVRRQRRWDLLKPRIVFAVAFYSIANGLGEMYGFLFGAGDVAAALATFEFARHRQMCPADLVHPPVGGAHRVLQESRTGPSSAPALARQAVS